MNVPDPGPWVPPATGQQSPPPNAANPDSATTAPAGQPPEFGSGAAQGAPAPYEPTPYTQTPYTQPYPPGSGGGPSAFEHPPGTGAAFPGGEEAGSAAPYGTYPPSAQSQSPYTTPAHPVPGEPIPPAAGAAQPTQTIQPNQPAQPAGPVPTSHFGYGSFTFPEMASPGTDPLAVVAIIGSVLPPAGIGFGIAALVRIRRNGKRGRGLAIGGIVINLIVAIALVLTLVTFALNGTLSRLTEEPQSGDVDSARTIATANVATGNCIGSLPVGDAAGEVELVPCDEDHEAQVVTVSDGSGAYPGSTELHDAAAATCAAEVEGVTGDSTLRPWHFVPSEQGWEEGNTATVCLIRSTGGPLTTDDVN